MKQSFLPKIFFGNLSFAVGNEGFYAILKTRLNLENFSGKTVKSVYQDLYSTIYLTRLESILTSDIDEQLDKKPT
ncbi:hypothetical protein QUF74_07100 [Candidatus Halobeggiatoa sp. HSG11]|nr:hypothetical protein [Candidatus Halobeggiatoa sp. HSG11]